MPEIPLIIRHEAGLHARPAVQFVQTAKRFNSDIKIAYADREANAKSLVGLLSLGIGAGAPAPAIIRAEGTDAPQALEALRVLVERNFTES